MNKMPQVVSFLAKEYKEYHPLLHELRFDRVGIYLKASIPGKLSCHSRLCCAKRNYFFMYKVILWEYFIELKYI